MLSEGTTAPKFELPALVDGERCRVGLDDYVGDDVLIVAFYPADFNPACDTESCDLDELDLFTMQKDVTILGISPDSVYSHKAFADAYDLKVPLLADTDGIAARLFGIDFVDDIGQHLIERAVAVVDHDGVVQYSWSTDDMRKLPRVDEIKDAIAETGGDDTAFARYRVGHAHYTEGRRSFTSAMNGFEQSEWMMAQNDFRQAREEFEEAAARFDTAVRFVDDTDLESLYDDANTKATALWQAADWLTEAASAYSSGSGSLGQELRDDAERPLTTARDYSEPPDPDEEWPPGTDTLEKDEDESHSILPTSPETADATLDVDLDDELAEGAEDIELDDTTQSESQQSQHADTPTETVDDGDPTTDPATTDQQADDEEDDIDDAELAEIQAELEANNPDSEPSADDLTDEPTSIVDAPPMERDGQQTDETSDDETVESQTRQVDTVDEEEREISTLSDADETATDGGSNDRDRPRRTRRRGPTGRTGGRCGRRGHGRSDRPGRGQRRGPSGRASGRRRRRVADSHTRRPDSVAHDEAVDTAQTSPASARSDSTSGDETAIDGELDLSDPISESVEDDG